MDKRVKMFLKVILILLAVGMAVTIIVLVYYARGYADDRKANDEIKEIAYVSDETVLESELESDSKAEPTEERVTIDFEALKEINPDTVGWIQACAGEIDGPVVWTDDNEFYLTHKFDKSEGSVGCFFADHLVTSPFASPVTVVYGHNRKDGSMFHPLLNYKQQEYIEDAPEFKVITPDGERSYRIFSAYYADNDDVFDQTYADAIRGDEKSVAALYSEAASKSLFETGDDKADADVKAIKAGKADIVIMSTCEYSGDNNRMVVYGIGNGTN